MRLPSAGISPPLPLVTALLLGQVVGALVGCGAERAVRIGVDVPVGASDVLCIVAHGDGEIVFSAPYDVFELPAGERSLTFVAGARVSEELAVSASIAREGAILARGTTTARFSDQGGGLQTIRPRRCQTTGGAGSTRPGGTFAALATVPRLIAEDVDGDGRDELLAIGADGTLQVLDAEDRDAGSRRMTELRAPDGLLVASGDLDRDCLPEIVAVAATGALVVVGADGSSPSPVGEAVRDVAVGVTTELGDVALAIAGDGGLSVTPWDADAPRMLAAGMLAHVVAGDLTRDGLGDLIASGPAGTIAVIATDAGFRDEPGTLPASITGAIGPIALGDLDGDGALDLASASGATFRIAINRGDGLLEDRTGASLPMVETEIVRIEIADLDSDCADEIVVRDAMGAVTVHTRDALGAITALGGVPSEPVLDAVTLDADGDGRRELALVSLAGAVTLWTP